MPRRHPIAPAWLTATLAIACTLPACRKAADTAAADGPAPPPLKPLPAWFARNQLGDAPTSFLRRHANAPIHWQPWTKETAAVATESRRLLFIVVGSPLYPATDQTLATLHGNPKVVAALNQGPAIPVLIDAEANREIARFAAVLATEIRKPVAFPFFAWLSPEGNPVAWIPADRPNPQAILDFFEQSHSMVLDMWDESPDYVCTNSKRDAELRARRLAGPAEIKPLQLGPRQFEQALARICGLFDATNEDIDGSGGLFPSGTLEFLGSAATSRQLSASTRRQTLEVLRSYSRALLRSPAIDPLDGGICLARRGTGWTLPVFTRDTSTQARAALALIHVWRATGDQACLDTALRALRFADSALGTGSGAAGQTIHSVSCPRGGDSAFLWTLEDLKTLLDPDEFGLVSRAMDIRGLGNIPPENDPNREFFRDNALALRQTTDELAAAIGRPAGEISALLDSACRKLLKARQQRPLQPFTETTVYSRNLARLVSAHAAAFAATGDQGQLERALQLAKSLRDDFFKPDAGLAQIRATADAAYTDGRALDYALAIHAAIDLHNVTLDPAWIQWAQQLVDLATERHVRDKRLLECNPDVAPAGFPVVDSSMMFEESSVGLFVGVIARLSVFDRSMPPALLEATARHAPANMDYPIVLTDLLATSAARHLHPLIRIPGNPDAIRQFLPVTRTLGPRFACIVTLPPDAPQTTVSVEFPGTDAPLQAASPDELRRILQPPPATGP